MRFEHKPEAPWPKDRTKRQKTGFLWFPKRIGLETRWLEEATWEEQVVIWISALSKERLYWTWETTRWLGANESSED